ncbi:hypothetical protein Sta7437_3868 [Stanieria cyanosphaera PCC 7437]|uniref:Uncharacterized protein n=1 Tax=Stanieria cyanosphaera (strain ATCC 29371 / PCC 7437) TaxID=111780 RepID=K9Y081_STAC7|nr:hypothetical protein [Stanieria cyanosphaera]AFZ37352.1 hypothetical protein Sta7437_3868 [Stanieria cyanosphaera PCC 7437]
MQFCRTRLRLTALLLNLLRYILLLHPWASTCLRTAVAKSKKNQTVLCDLGTAEARSDRYSFLLKDWTTILKHLNQI